jgi:hypothetical protein
MRLLATRRRLGQRIQRRPSRRRLSRQPISRLPLLNRVLSLRQLQEMGRRRNERKAVDGLRPSFSTHVRRGERGAPVLVKKAVWVSRVVGV